MTDYMIVEVVADGLIGCPVRRRLADLTDMESRPCF